MTRKMRTIAQFSIRDPDGSDASGMTEIGAGGGGSDSMLLMAGSGSMGLSTGMSMSMTQPKSGSIRGMGAGIGAPSLKRVAEDESQLQQQRQQQRQHNQYGQYDDQYVSQEQQQQYGSGSQTSDSSGLALHVGPEEYRAMSGGIAEMPAQRYGNVRNNDDEMSTDSIYGGGGGVSLHSDVTPTGHQQQAFNLSASGTSSDYPLRASYSDDNRTAGGASANSNTDVGGLDISSIATGHGTNYNNNDTGTYNSTTESQSQGFVGSNVALEDGAVLGRLRRRSEAAASEEEEPWPMEAIMHMNLGA